MLVAFAGAAGARTVRRPECVAATARARDPQSMGRRVSASERALDGGERGRIITAKATRE